MIILIKTTPLELNFLISRMCSSPNFAAALMKMVDRELDEAVLVIQEAASKFSSASKQLESFDGKQDELIANVKVLTEKVANLEATVSHRVNKTKKSRSVSLFDRVCLLATNYKHS